MWAPASMQHTFLRIISNKLGTKDARTINVVCAVGLQEAVVRGLVH
jgi:hypothetical protein